MRKHTRNLQTYKSLLGRYCVRISVEKPSKLTYTRILHSVPHSPHKIAGSATVYRTLSPLSKRLPTPRHITSFVTTTCTIEKRVTKNQASYFLKHPTHGAEMVLFHFIYYLTKYALDHSLKTTPTRQTHPSATVSSVEVLFWDITQCTAAIPYRRFGTTHRAHFQESSLKDYQHTLRNIPEKRGAHPLRG